MPSKTFEFFKHSLGVAITALAVGLGLFIGVAGPGRAQDKQAAQPQYKWANTDEYNDAKAAADEKDNAKRLAALDKWKKDFPSTDPKVLELRQDLYLGTYAAMNDARHTIDEAQEILKDRPYNYLALANTVNLVMNVKPAPSPADLDAGEKAARTLLDHGDMVFTADNMPRGMTPDAINQAKGQIKPFAETALVKIFVARKDTKRAIDDLRKLIEQDPTVALASYNLGSKMLDADKQNNTPQDQPNAFWQLARAAAYAGPGALPAADRQTAQNFVKSAYTQYHGSADGLDDLLAAAKNSPFPPAGFHIDSTVDIAQRAAAADAAERAKDPMVYLWTHTLKENLLMPNGDMFWDMSVKDAELPPPDASGMPQFFSAKIVSMTPENRPKEITVAIEKSGTADATLKFENPLPGKMEAGETIQFKGQASEWTKEPFMITFLVDPKEGLKGWTGKNAAPGRGRGRAGTKSGTKAAPKE